ncbi:MAG: peroxide stress protein YaaA [Acidimicrobiia bacterium]
MAGLLILLPPSEGKAIGGTGAFEVDSGAFGPVLAAHRKEAVAALAKAAAGPNAAKLFGVSGDTLSRAIAADTSILGSPCLPAHQRYTGVVWDHLGPMNLSSPARKRARESIVVVSGLLGAVRYDDPVPDYRCKMGIALAPLGKLSTWWQPTLTDVLGAAVDGTTVVDLLPNEHRAALNVDALAGAARRYVRIEFTKAAGGAAAGHGAKAAKGFAARAILSAAPTKLDRTLEAFVVEPGTPVGAWTFAGARTKGRTTIVEICAR